MKCMHVPLFAPHPFPGTINREFRRAERANATPVTRSN